MHNTPGSLPALLAEYSMPDSQREVIDKDNSKGKKAQLF